MKAARQACRPKHQVLVLKCYPNVAKTTTAAGAVTPRANSSELAYLLYYASTRRSKLAKVCAFLDKRAAREVWRKNTGGVDVTLQLAHALVEKCPRDLPLFAASLLRILHTVLARGDVAMVEASVPVWAAVCRHQEPAALAADADYIRLYHDTVHAYARCAAYSTTAAAAAASSLPVAVRYRHAGLAALRAVAAAPSLASETARQLAAVVPAILCNLDADDAHVDTEAGDDAAHLRRLLARIDEADVEANVDADPHDGAGGDAIAAAGTTKDADRRAQDEVGVLALQALRQLFQGGNRGLLRLATTAVLDFLVSPPGPSNGPHSVSWATTLMAAVCAWAPVQDRYTMLVAAVEALVQSPLAASDDDNTDIENHTNNTTTTTNNTNIPRQLVLAAVVDHLLTSPINFIGLSVMDVLVALLSHTLSLLYRAGPDALAQTPSAAHIDLLHLLQGSIAGLATHVYYTDHVSDMVDALLSRLKPSRLGSVSSAADATIATTATPEKTHVDRFFSFETARITALESVKAIINTANARRPDGSTASVARSRVGVVVWEGTHWLLRDPSGNVRKAYVDALVTWLNAEKTPHDLEIVDNYRRKEKAGDKGALARRAVSNASQREPAPKRAKDTFLSLLHLAIYENALHHVDSEPDYLLLHLLLTTLVNRLGVNAARTGLPMIMRLQEDIATIEDAAAKVRIGSLVHGYLWALSTALDFEVSSVGRALHNEITRRGNKGLWVQSIRVPPTPVDLIPTPHPSTVALPNQVVQNEALRPFDNREALVDKISEGYAASLSSPPSSPPASPGRPRAQSSTIPAIHQPAHQPSPNSHDAPSLPYKVRQDLLAEWSRDTCLAANTKDASSASISGSRSGTLYTATMKSNYLGVSIPNAGLETSTSSPVPSPRRAHSRPPSAAAYGLVGSPGRSRSPGGGDPGSTSSMRSTVRVDDLRRALSTSRGGAPRTSHSQRAPLQRRRNASREEDDSSASESMVSVHSLSDASFLTNSHDPRSSEILDGGGETTPAATLTPRPGTANTTNVRDEYGATTATNGVPPVPPIPASLRTSSASIGPPGPAQQNTHVVPDALAQSDTRDFAKLNGNGIANGDVTVSKSSRSVKSSGGRGRTGERRGGDGSVGVEGERVTSKPDFTGFLDSIAGGDGLDDDDDGVGGGGGDDDGVLGPARAPY